MRTPKSAILEKHRCARVCRASLRIAINNTLILGCFQPYQCYNNLFIINTRYDSFVISNIYNSFIFAEVAAAQWERA
jgi:hypothetical protein